MPRSLDLSKIHIFTNRIRLLLDLEDAVAENQKDAARFSLFHALRSIDYRGCERVVRINGLDSPYWKEDIR